MGAQELSAEEKAHDVLPVVRVWVETKPWLPGPLFAAYPIWALWNGPFRQRRRKKRSECLTCGYFLTGNVSRVCPECGTAIRNAETQKTETQK